MNDKLEKALIEILETVTTSTGKAVDFLSGEIPEVAEQILNFHFYESIVMLIGNILLFFVGVSVPFVVYKLIKNNEGEMFFMVFTLFDLIILIPSSINIMKSVLKIIKISVAPKLYLIEYVSALIK